MDRIEDRAALWGIETEYQDGLGHRRVVEPGTVSRLLDIFRLTGAPPPRPISAIAASRAYQANNAPKKMWLLGVQLYGVRSRRNWGHGDFTDLGNLITLAAQLGAAGVGLNPLNTLFDERPDAYSPYSPSSRHFLNTRYIDPEAIPEFTAAEGTKDEIAGLRGGEFVDYQTAVKAKLQALELCYRSFVRNGSPERKQAFADFRARRGVELIRFACFEFLRGRFNAPWPEWPLAWRKPDDAALTALRKSEDFIGYYEFLQWIADAQLRAFRQQARALHLPIGLYLDIPVGVRTDGFDAWNEQGVIEPRLEIGAPPDRLNLEGQRWGLAGVNPMALEATKCDSFRRILQASMQYAGAIRLDHVMGLKRLYLIPSEMRADQGAYVEFPFAQLLEITAEESVANACVVIGEDLGTVPEHFRETLAQTGIWSYQVMMFERAADGGFIAPELYRENALVTFATHDLPTFAGWKSGHDLIIKRALGMDPGENEADRTAALDALGRAFTWRGLRNVDYANVTEFLADTPSRLLVVSMEDALGLVEQVNVPGTIAQHPNWRRRLPIDLEDLKSNPGLLSLSDILARKGQRA